MHFLVGVANPLFGKCQTCTKTHHETVFIKKNWGPLLVHGRQFIALDNFVACGKILILINVFLEN